MFSHRAIFLKSILKYFSWHVINTIYSTYAPVLLDFLKLVAKKKR